MPRCINKMFFLFLKIYKVDKKEIFFCIFLFRIKFVNKSVPPLINVQLFLSKKCTAFIVNKTIRLKEFSKKKLNKFQMNREHAFPHTLLIRIVVGS